MTPSVLARQIEQSLTGYLDASYAVTTPSFDGIVTDLAETPGAVFKGPYVGLQLPFLRAESDGEPFEHVHLGFRPYRHQRRAFERLGAAVPQSTLVATGTGSGKTESFLLPVLEWCAQHRGEGVKAVLIYPMNALAADQAQRVAALIHGNDALRGHVRAGLYVGQREASPRKTMEPNGLITDRETLRLDPPDLLLTNYKMLDYLMVRPRDAALWRHNGPETLRFLVVDELHTFDGAQATDLACLVRRLKDRLKTPPGGLTCVGTSATLGGDASGTELFAYASTVFGEPFGPDALVVEERETVADFLGAALVRTAGLPPEADWPRLDPDAAATPEAFVRDQARLWLGLDPPAADDAAARNTWAVALGEALKSHAVVQNLLKVLGGQPRSYDTLLEALGPITPGLAAASAADQRRLLDSLLALVAAARTWRRRPTPEHPDGTTEPFVQVRQDLWVREWRRMVASVATAPRLAFADDQTGADAARHLAVVHCRDCGLAGWGTVLPTGSRAFDDDLQTFYAAFFAYGPTTRFVFPTPDAPLGPTLDGDEVVDLCPSCLQMLTRDGACPGGCEGPPPFRVLVQNTVRKETLKSGATANKTTHDCAHCGARNGLTILGSRAASLASVAIGQTFASPFNDDKKLLVFSDSVQDASHRAGFFGARTYAFNLRRAFQTVAEVVGAGTPLPDLERAIVSHWRAALSPEAYVAAFLAPDMAWLQDYEALLADGRLPAGSGLATLVDRRVAWELLKEVGYHARIGRTLERAGVSMVHPDPERLDRAAGDLLPRLQNELGELRALSRPQLRRFLLGFLSRLRTQGAISHPLLDGYVESGGSTYLLNQDKALPGLGPNTRAPAFLTTHTGKERRFDTVASGTTWAAAWAVKALGDLSPLVESVVLPLYDLTLAALVRAGLLDVRRVGALVKGHADAPVWGLRPEALLLALGVDRLRCDTCGHQASAPTAERGDWVGLPCLRPRCAGHYGQNDTTSDYYARLYTHGDLHRVVAREHTGLLERDDREALEQAFVRDDRPWAPNLLSCTPTLEMGIDIGDLSTVLLASVPPAQANYLQRVGRAGRRDGNALTVTIAQGQPHDLYFFEDPTEMLTGAVAPPGVYLGAAAVLERQLSAFCFDNWVASGIPASALPARLSDVLKNLEGGKATAFPFSFLTFVEAHQTSLTDRFVALFDGTDDLDPDTVQHLQGFLSGSSAHDHQSLGYRLLDGLRAAEKERRDLRRRLTALRLAERTATEDVEKGVRPEAELKEIQKERWTVQKSIKTLEGRDTLEVLTSEGLLPNYAFPQAGVRLRSVVLRGKGKEPLAFEYERPAAAALSELAPGNTFYANGRAVEITEIDLAASSLEAWRLCDRCSYSELAQTTGTAPACPRCGSDGWADAGQVHTLVRMRTLQAATSDKKSRTLDTSDERTSTSFHRDLLVDVDPADVDYAYHLEGELPFGLEYARRAHFQEINAGPRGQSAHETTIAGVEAARPGFLLCTKCGRAGAAGKEIKHSVLCPAAQADAAAAAAAFVQSVFLYRDFESEAVRFLLPVADDTDSERTLASVVAAIELGLRRRFGGRIDHLQTTVQDEPVPGTSVRKRYLVLYDTVPGGTGYLKELAREPAQILDVLQQALDALDACACASDDSREACYRCLLQYRNRFDQTQISRALAARLLRSVLDRKDDLKPVDGLRRVGGERVFDSTLEAMFVRALAGPDASPPRTLAPRPVHGKPGHVLQVGTQAWLVEPQVSIGLDDGVLVPSRADFVLHPRRPAPGVRPIAVFTDGFAFHKSRVGLDSAQRLALVQSGRYHVWSLTYEDVARALDGGGAPDHVPLLAPRATVPQAARWPQLLAHYSASHALGALSGLATSGAFGALLRYLADPGPTRWTHLAVLQALVHTDPQTFGAAETRRAWENRASETLPSAWRDVAETAVQDGWLLGENAWDGARLATWAAVRPDALAALDPAGARVAVWLDDADLDGPQRALWGGALLAYTLLQFLPGAAFYTSSGKAQALYDALSPPPEPVSGPGPWDDVAELVDPVLKALVAELASAGLPVPEVGLDLTDTDGRVQVTAELVWEDARVAVLLDADVTPQPCLGAEWTFVAASDATESLLSAALANAPAAP